MFTDLPRDEQLDDLMRLSTLDSSSFKEDEIGSDLIKDQQKINMEFDSGQCAVLPEDRAQKLLVSVSIFFRCELSCLTITFFQALERDYCVVNNLVCFVGYAHVADVKRAGDASTTVTV